jgi:hypothetical protein
MFNLNYVKYRNNDNSKLPLVNYVNNITRNINPFYINNVNLLFFDIFYKNNKLYLIMPIYNEPYTINNFLLTLNNVNLIPSEKHIKDSYEPISIFIYDIANTSETGQAGQRNDSITIDILCNKVKKTYHLKHIDIDTTNTPNHFLTLTTLFKHDYSLFPFFYNYYTKQGVSHFYLYYNSTITQEIYKFFNRPQYKNVTLVEWNFHYWNPREFKYCHHAQMGQIHHALYRYGKDMSEYMIFCDFDEYLHIPLQPQSSQTPLLQDQTLHQYIKDNPSIDIFGFCNIWADSAHNEYPNTQITPKQIVAVSTHNPYCERSKNIYNVSSIKTTGIHQLCDDDYFSNLKSIVDLKMYHFYRWSSKGRVIENCTNPVEFSF